MIQPQRRGGAEKKSQGDFIIQPSVDPNAFGATLGGESKNKPTPTGLNQPATNTDTTPSGLKTNWGDRWWRSDYKAGRKNGIAVECGSTCVSRVQFGVSPN